MFFLASPFLAFINKSFGTLRVQAFSRFGPPGAVNRDEGLGKSKSRRIASRWHVAPFGKVFAPLFTKSGTPEASILRRSFAVIY